MTSSARSLPDQTRSQDFQWTLADQGGMLWTDNMAIPKGAVNKAQAQVFIDWYYDPANAAQIGRFVQLRVPGQGRGRGDARHRSRAGQPTPLIFPDAEMIARLHQFRSLDLDTAHGVEDAFDEVIGL